jgi:acyl-CoA thioesterase
MSSAAGTPDDPTPPAAPALDAAAVPVGDLLTDIDVQADPSRAGRYTLDISPAWNVFYTFGGVSMAVAMRAAERSLTRDDLVPQSAHVVYLAPVGPGPVEIDVDVTRNGRTAANVCADMRQVGHEGVDLRLLATFGQVHDTHVAYRGVEFPSDVLMPDACPTRPDPAEFSEARNPFPDINFHHQHDWRPALAGFSWTENWGSTGPSEPRFASWFRLYEEPRLADGSIDPVAYCVPADMLGPAIGRQAGPMSEDNPPFLILSLEINLQFFAATKADWILQHVVSQWAGNGYAYGTTELWDDQRQLIGMATQRARLRGFDPAKRLGPP